METGGALSPSLWVVCTLSVLILRYTGAVQVRHTIIQEQVTQTFGWLGEYMFQLDGDEIFNVQAASKQVSWRLPDFETFTSFEAQAALGNLAVQKINLETLIKASNRSAAKNDPPEVMVFTENPLELGEPNVLICFMNKFFPPAINVTWLKNGEPVYQGVAETDFYPNADFSFSKFLYLTFIPIEGDEYACSVDHWGLERPVNRLWDAQVPQQPSEETQTVVCALGLAVGIIGVIVGTILIIKGMRNGAGPRRGGR